MPIAIEAKVNRREQLKQEIIDRRVSELLNEDAELHWESLATAGAPVVPRPSTQAPTYQAPTGPLLPDAGTAGLPPIHTGEDYLIAKSTPMTLTPIPELTNGYSVAEAKVRLDAAKRDAERVRKLSSDGVVSNDELNRAEYALQVAELLHQRSIAEFEGVRKI